jgi:hypothetical protein
MSERVPSGDNRLNLLRRLVRPETMKNVAWTSCRRNTARIAGVLAVGASSMVRKIVFPSVGMRKMMSPKQAPSTRGATNGNRATPATTSASAITTRRHRFFIP